MAGLEPEQCRAARALLGWTQQKLADKSKTAQKTIADFELGATAPRDGTLNKLRACLEKAGVEFIERNGGGPGARLKQ